MKNRCVITFEGLNVNRLLNSLCRQNITVYGVSRSGKKCILQVDARHSQKVVAQLKERCYNILDIRYTGVSLGLRFAKLRFALIACALLCVAVLAVSSQFCLRIETQGDFADADVCEALSHAGVKVGTSLRSFDPDVVENAVASELNAMYAVVNRRGSVIYVNAVATKQVDEPIDMSKHRDIVADVSGYVVEVLCEQGTPLVAVGSYVNKGDVLIEGRRVFNDGQSRDVYALGRVAIKQSVQGAAVFDGYKTETLATGNSCVKVGVVLFGKQYVNNCKYDNFNVETTYKYLPPLNIAICYNTYYETTNVTVACTLEDCMDSLKQTAYDVARGKCDFVPQGVEYSLQGNTVTATLTAVRYVS